MTPEVAQTALAELDIETDAAVKMIGNMIEEGVVAFASDDKTLLLLPLKWTA